MCPSIQMSVIEKGWMKIMNGDYKWIKKLPEKYSEAKNKMFKMPAKPNKTIREHTDDLLKRAETLRKLNYISEDIFQLLYIACEYHDIGKANTEFEKRIHTNGKFNNKKEVVHNILSLYMMPDKEFITDNDADYYIILFAIVYHHDYVKNIFTEYLRDEENKKKISNLLEPYSAVLKKKKVRKIGTEIMRIINSADYFEKAVKVKGLLHKCDYSASGNYEIEYENDFLKQYMDKLPEKWKSDPNVVGKKTEKSTLEKGVNQEKTPKKDDEKITWNEMQVFCKENRENNIIVVAQTGMGKTEGSLLWLGNNKGYYILPVRTAINAMYCRIKEDIIENEDYEHRLSVLHSNTLEIYLSDKNIKGKDVIDYSERGRNLSMPLTISTLDQLFDFVYKYQGYELKLATLSYSKIIIDEIQMYEPKLLAYIMYGIKLITRLGGKVAIMTATLPPYIYDMFHNVGFEFKYQEFQDDLLRHNVLVKDEQINVNDICEKYLENKNKCKANKILVICNYVKKSQSIYKELVECLEDESNNIHLLHSKFMRSDRNEKERKIKECGQGDGVENEIWISTSLVEASLDIDFDYLFTELQDLNSLLQRFGRCNRKGRKPIDDINVYVYTEIEDYILRKKNNPNRGFIDKDIYELSKEAIKDAELGMNGLVTEKQKLELLKKYFTKEKVKETKFMEDYSETYRMLENQRTYDFERKEIDFRNINNVDIIPNSVFMDNQEQILQLEEMLKRNDKLKDGGMNDEDRVMERKRLEERLKRFVVSVGIWEYKDYVNACYKGKADKFRKIRINDYEEIPVMECNYDKDLGYSRIDFKNRQVEALFW